MGVEDRLALLLGRRMKPLTAVLVLVQWSALAWAGVHLARPSLARSLEVRVGMPLPDLPQAIISLIAVVLVLMMHGDLIRRREELLTGIKTSGYEVPIDEARATWVMLAVGGIILISLALAYLQISRAA